MTRKTLRTSLLSVGLVLGLSATSYVAGQTNPPLCHATGNGGFSTIFPNDSAYDAHSMHGDQPAGPGGCGVTVTPTATPEPLTMLLFGAGLAGVGYAKRRMGRKEEQ